MVSESDGDFTGEIGGEQTSNFFLVHSLADAPHQFGHSGLGGHIFSLDHAQLQQLVADLVDLEIGTVLMALGGNHHADAGFHGIADALETLVQHIDTAQAEGFHNHTLVAHAH